MPSEYMHDHGEPTLARDLDQIDAHLFGRRKVLGWVLSSGAAVLVSGCGGDSGGGTSAASGSSGGSSSSSGSASSSGSGSSSSGASTAAACVADPEETNGPYPSDGTNSVNGVVSNILTSSGIVRSDIRSSFGASTTEAPGVPFTLTITLADTSTACALLTSYAIYIWHCNRDGDYSLYSSGIQNENYLRGVQQTDGNGQVTFQTIFPACYSGRYPHIHVEVYQSLAMATGQANAILTTQMAMPREVCSTVYSSATGYSQSVTNLAAVTTSSDNVFDSSTSAQLTAQTPVLSGNVNDGYTGSITIGIAV